MLIDKLETSLKIASIAAAAVFFLWKILTGWLIINLQVSLDLKRQAFDAKNDILAMQLNLQKGAIDTLWLQDITLRVTAESLPGKSAVIEFPEIHQLAVANGKLNWSSQNQEDKKITLSPDESMQLAKFISIPKGEVALVEAAVFGDRTFWSQGFQWRTSAISLPVCNGNCKNSDLHNAGLKIE